EQTVQGPCRRRGPRGGGRGGIAPRALCPAPAADDATDRHTPDDARPRPAHRHFILSAARPPPGDGAATRDQGGMTGGGCARRRGRCTGLPVAFALVPALIRGRPVGFPPPPRDGFGFSCDEPGPNEQALLWTN